MDGASKYVKGDATVGLIITLLNLIGGIVMGMMRDGESIGAAFNKCTTCTIGDGLVSQIPSLMMSLATGVLLQRKFRKKLILGIC